MDLFDYTPFFERLRGTPLEGSWSEETHRRIETALSRPRHGDFFRWREAVEALPPPPPDGIVDLRDGVTVTGTPPPGLAEALQALHPWRKGPYHLYGLHLDTEWRSDWKWDRVRPHIQSLNGRLVLDVGCGNGYHLRRMAAEGARLAVGVDPHLLYVAQFFALRRYLGEDRAWVLPLALEELPPAPAVFDTVFSMGVLYHRREPREHLRALKSFLRPGGELVLETLVVEGPESRQLRPRGRYAKMRNVHVIPSVPTLEAWLRADGWKDVRTVDVTPTTTEEQRSTPWMRFESLADFLDPRDPSRTVEGHPAPVRAVLLARK